MNYALLPILLSLTFLAIVISIMAIQHYKNFMVTFVLIPIAITAGLVVFFTIDALLGYPVPVPSVTKDSVYISHVVSKDRESIYVWIIEPGKDTPMAIGIPATENNKKQLNKAKKETKEGKPQLIGDKGSFMGKGSTVGGELTVYPLVVDIGVNKQKSAMEEYQEELQQQRNNYLERRQ